MSVSRCAFALRFNKPRCALQIEPYIRNTHSLQQNYRVRFYAAFPGGCLRGAVFWRAIARTSAGHTSEIGLHYRAGAKSALGILVFNETIGTAMGTSDVDTRIETISGIHD
jgi:hypothetical protein